MKKNDYIQNAKNTVLNRVRFHAPIVFDSQIDKRVLFENRIDSTKPIFKFDKPLNKNLIKAFAFALSEEKFNLLVSVSSLGKMSQKLLPKGTILYSNQNSSKSYLEMINKLNINYPSCSNYDVKYKEKFVKINGNVVNPCFKEYLLKDWIVNDGVVCDYQEFVLNGANYFMKFNNKQKLQRKVDLEFNIPLPKGYYYFKKFAKYVSIENLMTKEKMYLNFVTRNCKFSFSCVDGLENSTYCCINVKLSFWLKSKEEKIVFFNYGGNKFEIAGDNAIKQFKCLSVKKCCEIFDVKIKTQNSKFDLFFNSVLPQKIWINWINGKCDETLERKYISLKKMFVVGSKDFSFVDFKEIGLKEIGIFNGEYYKKILIVKSNQKFLKVGTTCFYNINGISNNSLLKKEPITLSFG